MARTTNLFKTPAPDSLLRLGDFALIETGVPGHPCRRQPYRSASITYDPNAAEILRYAQHGLCLIVVGWGGWRGISIRFPRPFRGVEIFLLKGVLETLIETEKI